MKSIITLLIVFALAAQANAQFDILGKIEDKIEQKIEQKTDEAIDKALEDPKPAESETTEGKTSGISSTSTTSTTSTTASATAEPAFKSYSKFDFVPGENVIFFDDYSQDAVGDFPAKWNSSGSGEISTMNSIPGKWLKIDKLITFSPEKKIAFPDNFTIEYDVVFEDDGQQTVGGFNTHLLEMENHENIRDDRGNGGIVLSFYNKHYSASNWNNTSPDNTFDNQNIDALDGQFGKKMKVSIWVQKQRVRLYLNERKVYDLPKAIPSGITINAFKLSSIWENPKYFSNFRIAVGAPDMRSKLMTEGKLVTRGIIFDVGSDKIKAESYGTLKEIAGALNENPGVRVKIVGHTDSDGDDAKNLELSKKRAISVKNSLAKDFAIDDARMDTDGKGESVPASPNTTPEGKANNRRVELIKL